MQSRDDIANEFKLRRIVNSMLEVQKRRFISKSLKQISENFKLRNILKSIISESDVEKVLMLVLL